MKIKLTYHLIAIIILLASNVSNAQDFDWVRTIEGPFLDDCYDVEVSANTGFIYSTGYFNTSADFLMGPDSLMSTSSGNCAYICKYDVYGELIWRRTLSSATGTSASYSIAIDSEDNVVIVGGYEGTVDFNPTDTEEEIHYTNNMDPFVSKFDSDGNFIWANILSCSYAFPATGVAIDADDNIIFCGKNRGSMSIQGAPFAFYSSNDRAYVCKFDSDGNYIWYNPFVDNIMTSYPNCITVGNDGKYYIGGAYTAEQGAGQTGFLQQVMSTGENGWRIELHGDSGNTGVTDVDYPASGLFVCGYFREGVLISGGLNGNYESGNGQNSDAVVFRLNSQTGFPVWISSFGYTGNDAAQGISVTSNGILYVTGTFEGTVQYTNGFQQTITANGTDAFLWKVDLNTGVGTDAFSLSNGVNDQISPYALTIGQEGAIYIGGSSYGTTDFDQDLTDTEEHTSAGLSDAFLHRTFDCDAFLHPHEYYYMCYGDSVEVNGTYYSAPDLAYSEPYVSQWGCDSTTVYHFNYYPDENTIDYTICPDDSLTIQYGLITEPGVYTSTNISSHGCDSTTYEYVDLIPVQHLYETFSFCEGDTLPLHNELITTPGNYTFYEINNNSGCRDTISAEVNFYYLNSSVAINGNSLMSNAIQATYQWIDCETNEIIAGAESQTYSPDSSGTYAVLVNKYGCEVTSDCIEIIITDIAEIDDYDFQLFPNPASEQLYIQSKDKSIKSFQIFDSKGRMVRNTGINRIQHGTYEIPIADLKPGVYEIIISTNRGENFERRFIVK